MEHILDLTGLTYLWGKIKNLFATGTAWRSQSIPFGTVDYTSTATAFTATVDGITELADGVTCYLKNTVVTSAAATTAPKCFTLNVNSLGAKPVYQVTAAASYATTHFTKNYKYLFTYDSSLNSGNGGWYIGQIFNTNTTYSDMTQAEITAGTGTTGRKITPKMLRDNFYTEDEVDDLLESKADNVTTVSHGTSDTTFALTPNVLHTWGTINSLTLSLVSGSSTYVDGYWFKFTAGSSFTALTLPTGVVWAAEPDIESNKTYEVLIVDGLATYTTEGIDSLYATKNWVESNYQAILTSGTTIKTINNTSLLGSGNISFDTTIVASSGSTLTATVDTIYTYSTTVSSLAVTLPSMNNSTVAKAVSIILTTGSSASLTFSSADNTTILYYDGYEIEDGTMYEINALYVGSAWIVGASKIATS